MRKTLPYRAFRRFNKRSNLRKTAFDLLYGLSEDGPVSILVGSLERQEDVGTDHSRYNFIIAPRFSRTGVKF